MAKELELEKVFADCLELLNTLKKSDSDRVACLTLERNLLLILLLFRNSRFYKESGSEAKLGVRSEKRNRIFEFIKKTGQADGGQLFNEFPNLSRRGIKRNLYKLIRLGLIERVVVNNNKTIYRVMNR